MYQKLACPSIFWAGMWGSHENTSGNTVGGGVRVVLEIGRLDIFQIKCEELLSGWKLGYW